MKFGSLVFLCFAACPLTAQIKPGTTVRVHVVDGVTGAPIAGASVVLNHDEDRLWGRTDAGGIFAGVAQSAGGHLLTVTHKGYRMTDRGMGKEVDIRAGTGADVTVQMRPLGVFAGRVLDQFGDPVRGAIVRTEDELSLPGEGQEYESYWAATTDDLGEYRISEVEPGKHYVAVEYKSKEDRLISRRWPQTGGLVLFPDATEIEQARQVEVAAGVTTHLEDMHLKVQRAVIIGGRIKPAPDGKTILPLSLQRLSKLALNTSALVQSAGSEPDGSFKMEAFPGKYVLTAADQKTGKMSKPLTLEVRDKDITGLELELTSGYEISGRIVAKGGARIDFSKLSLNFGGPQIKIASDGTFLTNMQVTKCYSRLQGLPDDWYVESILVAGKRIGGSWFEIEPGSTEVIYTLNPRGAHVSIGLEGGGTGLATAFVALLPEVGEVPLPDSMLSAQPDASGKFTVRAVPPGSYRVFTFDASNWGLLMRPDMLLEKHRQQAPLISVAEGEQKNIVIPQVKIQPE
jgi:hypothetical protein